MKKKRKTGNKEADEKMEGDFAMLTAVLAQCDRNHEDVKKLFTKSTQLQTDMEKSARKHADLGTTSSNAKTLLSFDIDLVMHWIVGNSDISETVMAAVYKYDNQAPYHLLSDALQISLKTHLPDCFGNVGLLTSYEGKRAKDLGNRLAHIYENGAIAANGKIKWDGVTYKREYVDGKLESLQHVASGQMATLPDGHGINTCFQFGNWWSEDDASAALPPFPGVKVIDFFVPETARRRVMLT